MVLSDIGPEIVVFYIFLTLVSHTKHCFYLSLICNHYLYCLYIGVNPQFSVWTFIENSVPPSESPLKFSFTLSFFYF